MTLPKVMIISAVPPSTSSVAHLWVKDICDHIPVDKKTLVITEGLTSALSQYDYPVLSLNLPRKPSFRRNPIGRILYRAILRRHYQSATRTIKHFVETHNPDIALVIQHGPDTARLALQLSRETQLPIVSLVWDPPEYIIKTPDKLDFFRRGYSRYLEDFYGLLKKSERCAVMSDAMAREYGKYTRTIVIHHGVSEMLVRRDKSPQLSSDRLIRIGVAGTIYRDMFTHFLNALDSMQWSVNGNDIELVLMSDTFTFQTKANCNIHFMGWRSVNETVRALSQCDVLYLPFSLKKDFGPASRLSFPTKLSTYVAAQTPILYHGAGDSTVADFFRSYSIGVMCNTNKQEDLVASLKKISLDMNIREKSQSSLIEAYDKELSTSQFRSRLAQLLGVEEDLLLETNNILN